VKRTILAAFPRVVRAMELITILNRCHRFPGFVYQQARFSSDHKSIQIAVRSRKGSKAICSRCHQPAPGYDQLAERRSSLSLSGGSWSFCFTRCGASIAAAARRSSSRRSPGAMANALSPKPTCYSWLVGPAGSPGRKPPRRFAPPGTRSSTRWNMWSPGPGAPCAWPD
jgi:hypothetical protein